MSADHDEDQRRLHRRYLQRVRRRDNIISIWMPCASVADHDPGYYNSADNCSWGINTFNNGSCTNWGNPQSEIFLERALFRRQDHARFQCERLQLYQQPDQCIIVG